jgi:hypothetical protein
MTKHSNNIMSNTILIATVLYGLCLGAHTILISYYPNSVTWYNNIKDDNNTLTIQSSAVDQRWTSLFIIAAILTLTSMVLSYISIRQIAILQLQAAVQWRANMHYMSIIVTWLIVMFLDGTMVYTYKPAHIPPYPMPYFQPAQASASALTSNCSLYYTDHNYTDCYTILPELNITHNRVCCLSILSSHYTLFISIVGKTLLVSTLIYPAWLGLCYLVISRQRRAIYNLE